MEIYEMVASTLYALQQRAEQLSYVPDIRDVTRAQNLLALSPHMIVTEAMQPNRQKPPEIKRVTVVDSDGAILFDQDFQPQCIQKWSLPSWNASAKLTSQPTRSILLTQIWNDLSKALSGHYILAYNLALVQTQLNTTAEHFQLPMPVLIGESILGLYFAYLGSTIMSMPEHPKDAYSLLTTAKNQLTASFLQESPYTTIERAQCMMHILQGIAAGTLTISSKFK